MIDLKELKSRRDEIAKNIAVRNMQVDIDAIIDLQEKRSALLQQVEELRSKRNENAKKMKGGKLDNETRNSLIAEGKSLKEAIAEIEGSLTQVEEEFQKLSRTIPTMPTLQPPLWERKTRTIRQSSSSVPPLPPSSPSKPLTMSSLLNGST